MPAWPTFSLQGPGLGSSDLDTSSPLKERATPAYPRGLRRSQRPPSAIKASPKSHRRRSVDLSTMESKRGQWGSLRGGSPGAGMTSLSRWFPEGDGARRAMADLSPEPDSATLKPYFVWCRNKRRHELEYAMQAYLYHSQKQEAVTSPTLPSPVKLARRRQHSPGWWDYVSREAGAELRAQAQLRGVGRDGVRTTHAPP